MKNEDYRLPEIEWKFDKAIEEYGLDVVFHYEFARTAFDVHQKFSHVFRIAHAVCSQDLSRREELGCDEDELSSIISDLELHHLSPFLCGMAPWIDPDGYRNTPLLNWNIHPALRGLAIGWASPADPVRFRMPEHYKDLYQWTNLMGEEMGEDHGAGIYISEGILHSKDEKPLLEQIERAASTKTWMAKSTYKPVGRLLAAGSHGFTTATLMEFNWAYSDSEILKLLKEFLKSNRPPRYRRSTKAATIKPTGIAGESFSSDMNSALKWLGIYRRRAAITFGKSEEAWSVYDQLYDEPGDLEGQFHKAKHIIEWFAHGGEVKPTPRMKKKGGNITVRERNPSWEDAHG